MALFEFENGRLIPAQFGRTVPDGLSDNILTSVREQVLEIIGRPLFPITWHDAGIGGPGGSPSEPRLTALDACGQVVSVEVLNELTSVTMIDSLSRLADTASMGWNDLAAAYPGGVQGFRLGWAEFRDSMPPSPAPGPRLILVVGAIADHVRPALDVLASSGVEVHELSVRSMSNGRLFIDVQTVGPRMYGHNPNLLLGSASPDTSLAALTNRTLPASEHTTNPTQTNATQPAHAQPAQLENQINENAPQIDGTRARTHTPTDTAQPETEEEKETTPDTDQTEETPETTQPASDAAKETADKDSRTQAQTPTHTETPGTGLEQGRYLQANAQGIRIIARILGSDTPLVWPHENTTHYATLELSGAIATDNWSTSDPNEAIALIDGNAQVDGWTQWRLGDAYGPSLAEALTEINEEIRAEYESAGEPRRGRRGR